MLTSLTPTDFIYLAIGAAGIGVSKAGFSGISMLHVVLYVFVFGAIESTGVLLPMLIVGDVLAIKLFGPEADWSHIRKLLPPTLVGVVIGWRLMGVLGDSSFKLIVGGIILSLTLVQLIRMWRPDWFDRVPHQRWFAITLGLLAGLTTMLANAAGPVVGLYLLAVCLPKWELIGTSAWLFFVLNVCKLPFSYQLGLITPASLGVGAVMAPMIPLGIWTGRYFVRRISQTWFNTILLALTAVAAFRLIGWI